MILDLPPNYTDKIPGKLELCKGMPVIMRKNDATVLGLTNGAEGVTVGWDSTNIAGRDYLDVLYVKLSNPVRPVNIGNLPTNVVPVVSRKETVECKHLDGTRRKVSRTQVPVNLNFAITSHSAQGKTRPTNVVSLRDMKSHTQIYTALSRGTTAA